MSKYLLLFLLIGSTVFAQTPIPASIKSFDWIIGQWQCEGHTPTGKVDYTFTQQVERPEGSHWFRFRAASKGDVDPALESDTSFLTFDSKAHLWRAFSFYESGAYSIGTAPDFVGNEQTWTGNTYENGVVKPWGRIVFQKLSSRIKRENFYKQRKNGKYQWIGSEVCTKGR